MHCVCMQVLALLPQDNTFARGSLYILKPKTKCILFDLDGTITVRLPYYRIATSVEAVLHGDTIFEVVLYSSMHAPTRRWPM